MRNSTSIVKCVVVALSALLCACAGTPPAGSSVVVAGDVVTMTLHVDGMTCPLTCVREVRAMLETAPGFIDAAFDPPTQTVVVTVAKGTDPQVVVAAITGRYQARLL